jgi:predicted outer membrane repeat protein
MAEVTVNHCLFIGNHAQRGGGAQVDRSTMIAHNSSFDGNRAVSNGGGIQVGGKYAVLKAHECEFKGNDAIRGGGLAFERGSEVSVEGSLVLGNRADLGGGVYANGTLGNRMIQTTIIIENTATIHGGGIFINAAAAFQIGADTSVEQNNAGGEGGGIYAVNANLLIVQSNCCHNTAGTSGGGLRSVSCAPTVQSSAVGGNAPSDVTGAIVNIGSVIGGGC